MNLIKYTIGWIVLSQLANANIYTATGSSNWNTEWWINGQPAFVGHGAYGVNVSKFIIDGDNNATLKLASIANTVLAKPVSKLVVGESIFDQGTDIWSYSGHNVIKGEVSFDFNVEQRNHWAWESADKLNDGDDFNEILFGIIELFKKAVKNKEQKTFLELPIGSWKVKRGEIEKKLMKDRLSIFRSIDKTTIKLVEKTNYKIRSGTKMILVYSDTGPLLKGDSQYNGTKIKLVVDYIYFFKKRGRWTMLFP